MGTLLRPGPAAAAASPISIASSSSAHGTAASPLCSGASRQALSGASFGADLILLMDGWMDGWSLGWLVAVAGGGRAWSSRHRVSVVAFRSPSPQVLATRWRRRSDTAVRSDVVAGGAAAAAAGDSTQALSGIQLNY